MSFDKRGKPIGIQAIDSALKLRYSGFEPMIFAPMLNIRAGGEDPLESIAVYERADPIAHWHFITYGFSDLYEKTNRTNPISGYGFELTFRILKGRDEQEPPEWAIMFLQSLARFVFSTGNRFDNGFYFSLNRETNFSSATELSTIAFSYDPELKPINTPNGIVVFLQIIGLTEDEKITMQSWNPIKFLEAISKELPLFITDLSRGSLLLEEQVKRRIQEGIDKDGSSTETILVKRVNWKEDKKIFGKKLEIFLPTENFTEIFNLLRFRLARGREFTLISPTLRVIFSIRDVSSIYINDFDLKILLDQKAVKDIIDKLSNNLKEFELVGLKNVKFKFD